MVLDKRDAGLCGARLSRRVDDAELQPDQFWPERNRLVHDRAGEFAAAKDIYDVDLVLARRFAKGAVALLAQNLGVTGIHRHNRVAGALYVAGDRIARPHRVWRES